MCDISEEVTELGNRKSTIFGCQIFSVAHIQMPRKIQVIGLFFK